MAEPRKNIKNIKQQTTFEKIEKLHPHKLFLYLSLLGSSLIFMFMITAYTTSRPETALEGFQIPKIFTVSTLILLISSYTISMLVSFYENDNVKQLRNYMGYTLLLGVAFIICQYIGWSELDTAGIYLTGKASGAYLYVISGLHGVHLLGGLIFLAYFFFQMIQVAKDPIKSLIMVTNPYQKIKLEMLTFFWHVIDGLWLILFLYLLFTF